MTNTSTQWHTKRGICVRSVCLLFMTDKEESPQWTNFSQVAQTHNVFDFLFNVASHGTVFSVVCYLTFQPYNASVCDCNHGTCSCSGGSSSGDGDNIKIIENKQIAQLVGSVFVDSFRNCVAHLLSLLMHWRHLYRVRAKALISPCQVLLTRI